MRNEEHRERGRLARAVTAARSRITYWAGRLLRHHQPDCHWIPVEVLVADHARRRSLERLLRAGSRRLSRTVSIPFTLEVAVVVQQSLRTDRQLAGCYQLWQRPYGGRCVLLRLALQLDGRQLSPDELLAVLAEQWIGVAMEQAEGTGMLVPVEIDSPPPMEIRSLAALRTDPLVTGRGTTQPNGQAA